MPTQDSIRTEAQQDDANPTGDGEASKESDLASHADAEEGKDEERKREEPKELVEVGASIWNDSLKHNSLDIPSGGPDRKKTADKDPAHEGQKEELDREQSATAGENASCDSETVEDDQYYAAVSSSSIIRKFAHGRVIETLSLVFRCALITIVKVPGFSVSLPHGADVVATRSNVTRTMVVLRRIWSASFDVEGGAAKRVVSFLTFLHVVHAAMAANSAPALSADAVLDEVTSFARSVVREFLKWLDISPTLAIDALSVLDKQTCTAYSITATDMRTRDEEEEERDLDDKSKNRN